MRIAVDGRNLVRTTTGIARYFVEICNALAAAEHEITLFMPGEPAAAGALSPKIRTDIAKFPGALGPTIWWMSALPARVRTGNFDVYWGPAHRLPSGLPRRLPRVVTIHDLVWRHAPETMRLRGLLADRLLMGRAIAGADIVCANSRATAGDVAAAFPEAAGRLRIVPPAVTALAGGGAPFAELATRLDITAPYVLFVGTPEPRKNLHRLIDAFAMLPEPVRSTHMLVICGGGGWKAADPMSVAARAGIADRVRPTGYVTDAELAALYAGARCLAMPSLFEGFGIPIIEAQRFGVPVLTSNSSSMPEAAGEGAVLVDPLDTKAIAGGLERLLVDDAVHRDLSDRALANSGRYSGEASARAMEAAFADAIAGHGDRQ